MRDPKKWAEMRCTVDVEIPGPGDSDLKVEFTFTLRYKLNGNDAEIDGPYTLGVHTEYGLDFGWDFDELSDRQQKPLEKAMREYLSSI